MSKLFVVGHGINVQGIYEDESAATQATVSLKPVVINDTIVKAAFYAADSEKFEIDRRKGIVVEKNGGNSYYLNDTIENNKW